MPAASQPNRPPLQDRDTPGPAQRRLAWPALALWIALELVVLRVALRTVIGLDHGWSLGTTFWDLGQDLAGILSGALAAALLATIPGRRRPRALWLALGAAAIAYVLAGSHLERPPARLWSPLSSTWPLALGLAVIGLGLALDLRRRAERPRPWLAPFGGRDGVLLPVLVAGLGIIGFAATFVLRPPEHDVALLVREYFDGPERERWDTRVAHPEIAPYVDALAPLPITHLGRPTIVMPPPCEIALAIRPEDGIARLAGGVCIDGRLARWLERRLERTGSLAATGPWSVTFEVEKNGARVFSRTIQIGADAPAPSDWISIADDLDDASPDLAPGRESGEAGILVRAGDQIVLRTTASDNAPAFDPAAWSPDAESKVGGLGFGGLVLERLGLQASRPSSPLQPNIVLVVMDTQRADRLGCYGYEQPTSPNIDALSRRGLTFDAAYATSSWTWPSTASILTGRWPEQHGVTSNASCYLWGSELTLAEVLREGGFLTAGFSGNNLIAPSQNFDQGFDSFDASAEFRKSDEFLPEALEWIEQHAAERFFLYLQLVDPHEPHRPLPEFAERFGVTQLPPGLPGFPAHPGQDSDPREQAFNVYTSRLLDPDSYSGDGHLLPEHAVPTAHRAFLDASYDASVATGDHYVGLLLEQLARLGLSEQTIVVFTSDHGEELFDHGRLAHGHTVHEELVRVPLVIAGPGIPAGVREPLAVSNKELFGTLARLGGVAPGGPGEPGFDLVLRDVPGYRRVMFSTEKAWVNGRTGLALYGLRSDDWALHWAPRALPWSLRTEPEVPEQRFGQSWLYAKAPDPFEHTDFSSFQVEVTETLAAELRAQLVRSNEQRPTGLGANEAVLEILHALGYIGSGSEDDDEDE